MASGTYIINHEDKAIVFTGNYTAIFEKNVVRGKIEIPQGLKAEFEGKTEKLPSKVQEAHDIIKSLFVSPPLNVKLGYIVEAENDKVKLRAWGIIINDVKSLFNRLSEMKIFPVDFNALSLKYSLPIKVIKDIIEKKPFEFEDEVYKEFLKKFGSMLPRVEDFKNFRIIINVSKEYGTVILLFNGNIIYSSKINYSTVSHYLLLSPRELIEELVFSIEGLVNLLGKAKSDLVLPGVVEGKLNQDVFQIRSVNEELSLPVKSVEEVSNFVQKLRKEIFNSFTS
ncbi:hypothetical protein [Sulfolobus acidocaldarius]|uniref:Uncharacterized protein n=4 Tax=Sulfolobus acidocaldarius TaxID=2285 RepID=Q4J9Y3_SULAC|nr:hypothetical protein [Sulfolobus acidocaldarius]AAY80396.1 hypothetical protein Saci_1039 [Sulfolobus acidocaldarius DSM 639]AGE70979.1 hypothetical protein SacN8_05040 [Sulfolobus acidocaldarius N8]AGE73250.1 hypothetical protein SacRon12I_05030 [Sulfolobus acidocaldarius Ron12/I]ALU28718.1 hypothetical protein ATY89_01265 [Sulfolobus acidocaldarius]ALU31436.1 hypothetical protein ATZ20_04300 [Sulfolobus acidocaldarius]